MERVVTYPSRSLAMVILPLEHITLLIEYTLLSSEEKKSDCPTQTV
jgi:hypothetical protein